MVNGKKVVMVMPAYNAASTLKKTLDELPADVVDEILLVDDCSRDDTVSQAERLGIKTVVHTCNTGYGGNQKTCYRTALEMGADVVVMVHPDYQYTPLIISAMVSPIANGVFDCMLGSRILGTGARKGGMPLYKYVANRALTCFQNFMIGYHLSEYHTGYRAFSRELLETIPFEDNSDDFVFDNQMLCQIIYSGYDIGEVTCPTRYMDDSSSISFARSVKYGLGVLRCSYETLGHRLGWIKSEFLKDVPKRGQAE
ncbi:glycosyltransferase family 2 protein [Desulfovibrio sp. JC010]|uniref:glycosyltransferase family 2 protein n=1 Tax=Desulfovibrio sp. JC010 TaxID=2593641 RepID=UPI0013D723F6|nr:glycosyltransferase family 2 protein [Desulfovibrio sp. JC010]NDV27784.1 glycosyltransferase family 2 protein [Desulfovibrio sp. JC010]